jgi:hypothetical protein
MFAIEDQRINDKETTRKRNNGLQKTLLILSNMTAALLPVYGILLAGKT